jgi:hypothetical protein
MSAGTRPQILCVEYICRSCVRPQRVAMRSGNGDMLWDIIGGDRTWRLSTCLFSSLRRSDRHERGVTGSFISRGQQGARFLWRLFLFKVTMATEMKLMMLTKCDGRSTRKKTGGCAKLQQPRISKTLCQAVPLFPPTLQNHQKQLKDDRGQTMTRYVTDFLDRVLDHRPGFPVYICGVWPAGGQSLATYRPTCLEVMFVTGRKVADLCGVQRLYRRYWASTRTRDDNCV